MVLSSISPAARRKVLPAIAILVVQLVAGLTPVYSQNAADQDQTSTNKSTVNNSSSGKGLCPYYGHRYIPPTTPPPVQAVVNSGMESDGAEFLLPFQGSLNKSAIAPVETVNQVAAIEPLIPNTSEPRYSQDLDQRALHADQSTQSVEHSNAAHTNKIFAHDKQGTTEQSNNESVLIASKEKQSEKAINVSKNSWPGAAGSNSYNSDHRKLAVKLYGGVMEGRDYEFGVRIDDLLTEALARNTKTKKIEMDVAHYHTRTTKATLGLKDSLDDATDYKGFSRSMEAADVILDKNLKAKSTASADYIKQRYVDQLHPKIVTKVMQIAMGMGLKDKDRGNEMVQSGERGLSELVGEKQAQNTVAMLSDWTNNLKIPDEIFNQQQWDVDGYRNKVNMATKMAMNSDPVVNDIVKSIRKFEHSKLASRAYGTFNATANAIEVFAPGFAIPVGVGIIQQGVVQATGGSEKRKLLRELYYDKRIESRYRTINEESQLAITNYQLALANHNTTLLACSESILSQLVGRECITDVLDKSVFHPQNATENSASQIPIAGRYVITR